MAALELSDADLLTAARDIVRSEAASIASVAEKIDGSIAKAIRMVFECSDEARGHHGVMAVTGVGKAGLVGQRISASFASTVGRLRTFLHPVEALHGDLGRVRRNDAAAAAILFR